MHMRLVRRHEVYTTFWRFAAERQRIFEQRVAGDPGPWTDDPILCHYKFCNAYRASDRVSQFLIRDVIYGAPGLSDADVALRVVLFRLFSKERTWKVIEDAVGGQLTCATFDVDRIGDALDRELAAGKRIYTAAFILCANNAFGHPRKHRNHLALIELMLRGGQLPLALARSQSLEDVYEHLRTYPLLGPFMAYQLAIDLNYSEVIDYSEDEFTVAGPGAQRGIRKVFSDTHGSADADVIRYLVDEQEDACQQLEIVAPTLFGRRLHAIDVQNLFCEVDKYCRVAFPDLTSNRSRIKSSFNPSSEPLELRYPPKWGLVIPDIKPVAAGPQLALT